MRIFAIVLLSALLVAGCGVLAPDGSRTAPQTGLGPEVGTPLVFPPQPATRDAADVHYATVTGNSPYNMSANCVVHDDTLVITGSAGKYAWAYYAMPSNGYDLTNLDVKLQVSGTKAYVGLSDYLRGSWVFGPQVASGTLTLKPTAANVSPDGYVMVAVVAYDFTVVTLQELTISRNEPAWQKSIVDDTGFTGEAVKLLSGTADGKPMLAYIDDYSDSVIMAHSPSAAPVATADWTTFVLSSGLDQLKFEKPLQAKIIDGKPAIVCYERTVDQLICKYASVAVPSSSNDFYERVVNSAFDPQQDSFSLDGIDGQIGFAISQPMQGLKLQRITASSFSVQPWSSSIIFPVNGNAPALARINGMLAACAYYSWSDIMYLRAVAAEPAGYDDWVMQLWGGMGWSQGGRLQLAAVPYGNYEVPAVAWATPSSKLPGIDWSGLSYRYATHATPGVNDWVANAVESSPGVDSFELAVIGGRPALVYHSQAEHYVMFAWAKGAAPTVPLDWQYSVIDYLAECPYVSLAEIGGAPAVAYMDGSAGVLWYARMQQ